jgi:V/A-type H+-transporting ATPase subunit C
MARGVSGYAALNARVRIMYSNLLTPSQLSALGEAPDLALLVEGLRGTVYRPSLDALKDRNLAARSIVHELKNRMASAYRSVLQAVPIHARRLLTQLYRQQEVTNLKAVLRGIATGSTRQGEGALWDRVRQLLFPYGPGSVVPAEAMVQAGSVAAAVELLRGTAYYHVLTPALKRYSSEQSLFPLEVALDLDYWRQLWAEARKLPGPDQGHALRIVGSLVDVNNLMWAIRYRVYQHLSEEELINYTLPFGYRVRDEDIRAVAAGADMATIVARRYPRIPDVNAMLEEPKKGLPSLEIELKRHVARQCVGAFLGNPFHVGEAVAYLVLLDLEIQDLIVLIEAKTSGLPVEKFSPFLVGGPALAA